MAIQLLVSNADGRSKIPTAFVITGPNIASQDLLFEQLSETLQETTRSKFVRLKSSEASNIKAALKKIVEDATSRGSLDDEDAELAFEVSLKTFRQTKETLMKDAGPKVPKL